MLARRGKSLARLLGVRGPGLCPFVVLLILLRPLFGRASILVLLAYEVWFLVSLWRCAFNCKYRATGYLLRTLIIVCPIAVLVTILLSMPTFQGF